MRAWILIMAGACFLSCENAKKLSTSSIKREIDRANFSISGDLLPDEFKAAAKENEYYMEITGSIGHFMVLRVRDNLSLTCEIYYKPYNWSRISYRIGNYHIAGDTLHITYKSLLDGDPRQIYLRPTLSVSWVTPAPPKYLLLNGHELLDPLRDQVFKKLKEPHSFTLRENQP